MKIADVSEFYSEGGGGIRTYSNCKLEAAHRLGHDVTIIAPRKQSGVDEKPGGRIVWIKSPPMPGDDRYAILLNKRSVYEALDHYAPELVEGSSAWQGGWFAAHWKSSAPRVMVFHQDFVAVFPHTYLDRYLTRAHIDKLFTPFWWHVSRLSKGYDATLTSGFWLADRLQTFGVHNPVTVPFGVDKELFSQARFSKETRAKIAARCGVPADVPLLLTVSRLHPEKRLPTLFEGFRKLTQDRQMGWIIYGAGVSQGYVEKQVAMTPGSYLAGYTDSREELAEAMASADAFYHGSAAETFGLVVAESLCAGLPVVVPSVGGANDLAFKGCSEVYEPGDAGQAEAAVNRMLGQDRNHIAEACQEARHQIFTMDDHFDKLFEYYGELIGGNRRATPNVARRR
jgi:alpha-1,6-mannosyltransferase